MLRYSKIFALFLILVSLAVSCNQKKKNEQEKETILKGKITVVVDETLTPIVEDQASIFESKYPAKIKIVSKSEGEVINDLLNQKNRVAVLARNLTEGEQKIFEEKKIVPRITPIATDAIALIANKNNNDTLIALKDVVDFMQVKNVSNIKGLVFDNPNSSTMRYLKQLSGIENMPSEGVFSFKTNAEVIQFVSENDGIIGVVGLNWLYQPTPEIQNYIDKINVLNVKKIGGDKFYAPSQNNLAEGTYPLVRDLFIINCQGYSGLGMGFSSFVAGDIGQRIILKSGLLPYKIPGRNIIIRNEINNDKK